MRVAGTPTVTPWSAPTYVHEYYIVLYLFFHAGGGFACVEVNVEPTQQCLGIIPIRIPIPLANGQQINIEIRVDPPIPVISPNGCATVRVNAPQCPRVPAP